MTTPRRAAAPELLAGLQRTQFHFDVWPADAEPARCCAANEIRPGDVVVWEFTEHNRRAPGSRYPARSGFGHCLECGKRKVLEHRRVTAAERWGQR